MHSISRLNAILLSFAGLFVVGLVDYHTGIEIRIFPLYFLPIMFAARHFDRNEAIGFALIATLTWFMCMWFGGRTYSHPFIWVINFITQGSAFVLVTLLYSQVKAALQRETAYSHTDTLTGLANSRSFFEQAGSVLRLCRRENRPLTLAYIDLDNFKTANDTHGHAFGDEVLRRVAELMRQSFRASDIVARMGGDEFAVVLPETAAADAGKALEHFRSHLPDLPELAMCSITASIGAVSYPVVPIDLEAVIHAADTVMYRVKNAGKNNIIVESL
ncbi:MAG: GGDEF domain-containing protein [Gammaproteobacteria bacterium]|nr:GGDEF domain-containing protein [Gammaproteobacteria bacterium]MCP5423547.1 GGDEF domain-containing protein [Gammaproteobacteria bacterium]